MAREISVVPSILLWVLWTLVTRGAALTAKSTYKMDSTYDCNPLGYLSVHRGRAVVVSGHSGSNTGLSDHCVLRFKPETRGDMLKVSLLSGAYVDSPDVGLEVSMPGAGSFSADYHSAPQPTVLELKDGRATLKLVRESMTIDYAFTIVVKAERRWDTAPKASGRIFCYRRVKRDNQCRGMVRRARYTSAEDCCAGRGQGFAERRVRLGRNRFRCTPCLGNVAHPDVTPAPRHVTSTPRTPSAPPTTTTTTTSTTRLSASISTTQASASTEETTKFYWPTPAGRDIHVGKPYVPLDDNGQPIVWEQWSPCSVTCGAGWRSRAKVCDNCDRNDYENVQSQPCMDNFYCPVDGNWGAWYPWNACSTSCGPGKRTRKRKCNYPPPAYGGERCEGDAVAYKDCEVEGCPVSGQWGPWSSYGPCSQSCGAGMRSRSRECDRPRPSPGGQPCQGQADEVITCQMADCPVHGQWSPWSKWTPCSATCDQGVTSRSRSCDSPAPQHGGEMCEGESSQQQFCYPTAPCPVDGGWSAWVNYGACRAPGCGRGLQIKSRLCNNPRTAHGGVACQGHKYKREACYTSRNCPKRNGGWCEWTKWSKCSATCREDAAPLQGRQRVCACPTPRYGGNGCQGELFQVKDCENITFCSPPIDDEKLPPAVQEDLDNKDLDEVSDKSTPGTTAALTEVPRGANRENIHYPENPDELSTPTLNRATPGPSVQRQAEKEITGATTSSFDRLGESKSDANLRRTGSAEADTEAEKIQHSGPRPTESRRGLSKGEERRRPLDSSSDGGDKVREMDASLDQGGVESTQYVRDGEKVKTPRNRHAHVSGDRTAYRSDDPNRYSTGADKASAKRQRMNTGSSRKRGRERRKNGVSRSEPRTLHLVLKGHNRQSRTSTSGQFEKTVGEP